MCADLRVRLSQHYVIWHVGCDFVMRDELVRRMLLEPDGDVALFRLVVAALALGRRQHLYSCWQSEHPRTGAEFSNLLSVVAVVVPVHHPRERRAVLHPALHPRRNVPEDVVVLDEKLALVRIERRRKEAAM